jgi:hypothetical protein
MTATRPVRGTCAVCRHWLPLKPSASAWAGTLGGVGECRRGPPFQDFRWTRTEAEGWCGRFEPAEPSKMPAAGFAVG